MNSLVNIDNEILITLIQERPILWDKTLDVFKDRNASTKAWYEVCLNLRSDFDQVDEKEKNYFGKEVMKRWKHLRDAFAKAEKNDKSNKTSGSQATKKRKYIFNDELQFLKKIYRNTETTESSIVENKDESEGTWQQPENAIHEGGLNTTTKEKALPRPKRKKMDEVDLKILKVLDKTEPPNPQMSFFNSLLPHTENFNNNEWLHFQMEVLKLISNIKNQKVAAPHNEKYSTQCPSQLQQHIQPTHYNPQPQTFPQPLQQPFPMVSYYPHPPQLPLSIPSVSTQNSPTFTTLASYPSQPSLLPHEDSSPSLVEKIKQTKTAEHFAEYVCGEDCERSSSVSSLNSSSTLDVNF